MLLSNKDYFAKHLIVGKNGVGFLVKTCSMNKKLTSAGINTAHIKPTNTVMLFGWKNKRLK